MKSTACAAWLWLACGLAAAGGVPAKIEGMARKAFGKHFLRVRGRRTPSRNLAELCPGWEFYATEVGFARPVPRSVPSINRYHDLAVRGDAAVGLHTPADAAAFLSALRLPVKDEPDALRRGLAFAELTHGTLRSALPKRESILKKFQLQRQADWDITLSAVADGWQVALTVCIDTTIDYCIRYRLRVGKHGAVAVLGRREVYAYSLYE